MRQIVSPLDGFSSPFGSLRGFSPAALFALNEPGVWYDPSDLTTMFQDRAGTTPVTAPGQTVGLVLDKSRGLVLSEELVPNGTFDDASGWSLGASWTISGGVASCSGTAGQRLLLNEGLLGQPIVFGKSYRVSGVVTGGPVGIILGQLTVMDAAVSGAFSVIIRAGAGGGTLDPDYFAIRDSGSAATVDNISVRELPGNHLTANADAARGLYGIEPLGGRRNLLTFTEQFDNAAWVKNTGFSVVANTVMAPDGSLTADTITAVSPGSSVSTSQLYSPQAGAHTATVYLKYDTAQWVQVFFGSTSFSGGSANFDLINGVIGSNITGSGTVADIADVGNGWYRCSLTKTATAGGNTSVCATVPVSSGAAARFGSEVSGAYHIWGAQLEAAASASAYQRVVTALEVTEAGKPSLPYILFDGADDGYVTPTISPDVYTSDGAARRNLLLYPTAFDNAAWTKQRVTVTANAAVAPDGSTTADRLASDGASGQVRAQQAVTVTSGATITASAYLKQGSDVDWVLITDDIFSTTKGVWFNLSTGALGAQGVGYVGAITPAGEGFYRCAVTFTAASGTPTAHYALVDSNSSNALTGDVAKNILIWGAQLELGSTATAFQNIGTDKAQVFAGVRKLSDAAIGMVAEFSATVGSNAGTFYLTGPENTGASGNFTFKSRGSVNPAAFASSGVQLAPVTAVLSGLGDIAADLATIRFNGVATAYSADQGTGNLLAYPLYVGRRGGTTLPFNGRLYQLVVRFGPNLDTSRIEQVERFVNGKTGAY